MAGKGCALHYWVHVRIKRLHEDIKVTTAKDVIENGNSFKPEAHTTTNDAGTSTTLIPETRFGGNEARKKTPKTLLKQCMRTLVLQAQSLLIVFLTGFRRISLPSEWNTHVVVWRNKSDLDTMSIDDLYNNFKIVEQEVKGITSSNSSSQNMAFVLYPSTNSTNEVPTAYGVNTASTQSSTTSTQVSIASSQTSTANLSDAIVYAFFANQSNASQLVHEDLEQIYENNLKEMDLKWIVNVEQTPPKAMVAIDGVGFDGSIMANDKVPTNMALMAFSDSELDLSNSGLEEFKQLECQSYEPKSCEIESKNASKCIPNELKESLDASLVKDMVLKNKDCPVESPVVVEKKTDVPTIAKVKFVRPKQQEKQVRKSVKYAEMYRSQVNTARPRPVNITRPVNTARPRLVNTARPNLAVVSAVMATCPISLTLRNLMKDMLPLGDEQMVAELLVKELLKLNSVLFTDIGCFILSPDFKLTDESQVLLKVSRRNNMYSVDMKNIVPKEGLTCLVAKAIVDESMLWHRTLGHIDFKNINKLVKDNRVRASKDETTGILKKFITEIENLLDKKAKVIRCDNETEFKNSVMNDFCVMKGIRRDFSVARTPQQNGVAEKRNKTLFEAARTILADSKLPTTFWAEAVNTACYV
nr:ribonuclease H-like domain-containing protein [Tanacetum cinerariifolium]